MIKHDNSSLHCCSGWKRPVTLSAAVGLGWGLPSITFCDLVICCCISPQRGKWMDYSHLLLHSFYCWQYHWNKLQNDMKMYMGMKVWVHTVSTLALGGGEWSAVCSTHFISVERLLLSRKLHGSQSWFDENNHWPQPVNDLSYPACTWSLIWAIRMHGD
jgi:hypothetical protein